MKPYISIIIPAYNSERTIGKSLEACQAQDYPNDRFEIIVINDGSRDGTEKIIKYYDVRYICHQGNKGPASARNTGWKNAKGDYVFFLDSDCIPDRDWLSKTMAHYTREDIVCVGGRYGIANEESLLASCIYTEFLVRYSRMPGFTKYIGSHGYSFRKNFLERIGGYNEEYTAASGEDNDLAYRILASGYKPMFDQEIVIRHYFPTRLLSYLKTQMIHGYWRMKLYKDFPKMMKGDEYSTPWDFAQPPLSLVLILLAPFIFLHNTIKIIWLGLTFVTIGLHLPMTIGVVRKSGMIKLSFYLPLSLTRSVARGIGMSIGILKFWIFNR